MAFTLPRLRQAIAIVTSQGWPTPDFLLWWQSVVEKIEEQIDGLSQAVVDITAAQAAADAAQSDVDVAVTDIASAQAAITALDGRIDAYDALAPFVRQNQAALPAYTPYGGQTVSNPPTQAEMQALDDAVADLSAAFDTLLTRLDTVNLLT